MDKHVRLLGLLYIVYGALHLLSALVGWIVIRWAGVSHEAVPGQMVGLFLLANTLIRVLILFVVIMSAAGIVGGIGLLNKRRWARILLLVLSFLNLVQFPLGTALGAYGIWVLMNDETDSLFSSSRGSVSQQHLTPGQ